LGCCTREMVAMNRAQVIARYPTMLEMQCNRANLTTKSRMYQFQAITCSISHMRVDKTPSMHFHELYSNLPACLFFQPLYVPKHKSATISQHTTKRLHLRQIPRPQPIRRSHLLPHLSRRNISRVHINRLTLLIRNRDLAPILIQTKVPRRKSPTRH
jgi:hypothetical protein